jgi:hypothetical protein
VTRDDLIAFGLDRHGPQWQGKLAAEVGYSRSMLCLIAKGQRGVSVRLARAIELLKRQ